MKKIILLFACMMLVSSMLAQRSTTVSNFKGGLRIGGMTSQMSADNLAGFDQFGAYAGAFVNFPLSDDLKWKIQLEMNFAMKGSHSKAIKRPQQQQNPSYGKYSMSLGYIEVPALIKWNFGKFFTVNGKPVLNGLEVEAGPMFGVNLYQREKDMYGLIQGRPQVNRFEFAVIGGLACLFKEHHGVSLRYSNSVWPVRRPNWVVNGYTKLQFNSSIMLSYFYQF